MFPNIANLLSFVVNIVLIKSMLWRHTMRLWITHFILCGVVFLLFLCYNLKKQRGDIMGKVMYCEKCGRMYHIFISRKCDFCGTKMKLLSEEMKQKYNIFNDSWSKLFSELSMLDTIDGENKRIEELISRQNEFVMNEITSNPLFSMEEYEKQIQKERQSLRRHSEYHKNQIHDCQAKNLEAIQKEKDKQNCIPKCPICGSTNIQKITIGTRAVKTAAFGVIGVVDDAGKTYKCDNCGSKF